MNGQSTIEQESPPMGFPIFWKEDFPVVCMFKTVEENKKRLAEANISEEQMKHELETLKFIEENYDKIHANDKVPITSFHL